MSSTIDNMSYGIPENQFRLVADSGKLHEMTERIREYMEFLNLDIPISSEDKHDLKSFSIPEKSKRRLISKINWPMDRYIFKYEMKNYFPHVRNYLGVLDKISSENERKKREEFDPLRSYCFPIIGMGIKNKNGRLYNIPYNVMSMEARAKLVQI